MNKFFATLAKRREQKERPPHTRGRTRGATAEIFHFKFAFGHMKGMNYCLWCFGTLFSVRSALIRTNGVDLVSVHRQVGICIANRIERENIMSQNPSGKSIFVAQTFEHSPYFPPPLDSAHIIVTSSVSRAGCDSHSAGEKAFKALPKKDDFLFHFLRRRLRACT